MPRKRGAAKYEELVFKRKGEKPLREPQSNAQAWEDWAPRTSENWLAREAKDKAEPLRAIFDKLRGLSGRMAAYELNRRGIKTPGGGRWHQAQVDRVRKRLGNWP